MFSWCLGVSVVSLFFPAVPSAPEERAIAYLAREVPAWSAHNHCFSCHNNGDAARALYAARRLGYRVPASALASTTRWLLHPALWDQNRGDPRFSDKRLARLQFAAGVAEAFRASAIRDRSVLIDAASSLLPYADRDGAWPVDAESAAGSPVTYGPALATSIARRTLQAAGPGHFPGPIDRAGRWLLALDPASVVDAAAIALAFVGDPLPEYAAHRRRALDLIIKSPASDGGWGPYSLSPSEPFDTALALLALRTAEATLDVRALIGRGRRYLIQTQLPTGGWTETTRPPGGRSYAQHISTSAWATFALLETAPSRQRGRPGTSLH